MGHGRDIWSKLGVPEWDGMLMQMLCGICVGAGFSFLGPRVTSPNIVGEAGRMQATVGASAASEIDDAIHLLNNPNLMTPDCAYGLRRTMSRFRMLNGTHVSDWAVRLDSRAPSQLE